MRPIPCDLCQLHHLPGRCAARVARALRLRLRREVIRRLAEKRRAA